MSRYNYNLIHAGSVLALSGFLFTGCGSSPSTPAPRSVTATIHHISASGIGDEAGTVTFVEMPDGFRVEPNLRGFRPGFHAFHAHENASCEPAIGESGQLEAGRAAGPHYNGPVGQAAAQPSMPMVHEGMTHEGMQMEDMKDMPIDGASTQASSARMVMRGDMPQLTADASGAITTPVLKTGMTFDELLNRAVVMHPYGEEGKDPERPTDGSASVRIACGIVPKDSH